MYSSVLTLRAESNLLDSQSFYETPIVAIFDGGISLMPLWLQYATQPSQSSFFQRQEILKVSKRPVKKFSSSCGAFGKP